MTNRAAHPLALIGAAMALLLTGCQPDVSLTKAGPSRELQSCANSGGRIEARGRMQVPMCVHPFSDAGKRCADKADCQGRCLADAGPDGLPKAGEAAQGRCQADDRLFGCHAEVRGGKARPALCID